jgi:nicotinamide-nucleotide amidase
MEAQPTSTVISVGTELTQGSILNTHFRFLCSQLRALGYYTEKCVQIPDDQQLFTEELRRAAEYSALVIITGGLGPTSDDLTREVVADVFQAPLLFDQAIWDDLVTRYSSRGRTIAATNRKQALIPSGFRVLPNRVGTAPGFLGGRKSCTVLALPGPPAELEEMFLNEAAALIAAGGVQDPTAELIATALMIPESMLEQALQESGGSDAGISWSTRFAHDRIVFTLRGSSCQDRSRVFSQLLARFGPMRIREGDTQPSYLLYRLLSCRGERIAMAESCTGGLVSKLLTDLPGSSSVFWGTLVTYSDQSKSRLLGVPEELLAGYGAVSEQTASAMSAGLLERTPAEAAVAVTGIAGPEGGTPEKPVGTVWISARYRGGGHLCKGFRFHGSRDAVRRRSAVAAFVLAECVLLGVDADLEY